MSIEHTRVFYTLLMDYDSSVQTSSSPVKDHHQQPQQQATETRVDEIDTEDPLLDLLAPDCRIQSRYGDDSLGENGCEACLNRLRKFQHALLPLPAATRQGALIPFRSFQSVIYFFLEFHDLMENSSVLKDNVNIDEEKNMTIGIGLEWERGIVTGIVVRHEKGYYDPDSFLNLLMFSRRHEKNVDITAVILTSDDAEEGQLDLPQIAEKYTEVASVKCISRSFVDSELSRGKGKHVHFHNTLSVVLVPKISSRDDTGLDCFYSRQDYQHFSRHLDVEVSDVMRTMKLSQEQALKELFFLEGSASELKTELNSHILPTGGLDERLEKEDEGESQSSSSVGSETSNDDEDYRSRLFAQSSSCVDRATRGDLFNESLQFLRPRSLSAGAVMGHSSVGSSSSRGVMDDMEIDKLRFSLRIDQRTDDKEKARKENGSLLLRSYSTDGRVQSSADDSPGSPASGSSDDAPAGSERREGWYPGKILSHIVNKRSESSDESTGHEAAPRNFSVHSDQPSAQGGSSWYVGKYLKRLLAKSEHENGPSGWYLGKYYDKVVHSKSQPDTWHQRPGKSEATSPGGGHEPHSDSDSDSDSDDFVGVHRRSRKTLLPPLPRAGWLLGRSVARGGMPARPMEVIVAVRQCHNLRSSSLLPPYAPVAFVEVSLGDLAPVRTSLATRSTRPTFHDVPMSFSLSCCDALHEYVQLTVFERYVSTGQKVVLGHAQVSLAALPAVLHGGQPLSLTLPLRASLPTGAAGRGFCSSVADLRRSGVSSGHCSEGTIGSSPIGSISISISKVDPTMHHLLDVLLQQDKHNCHISRWADEEVDARLQRLR